MRGARPSRPLRIAAVTAFCALGTAPSAGAAPPSAGGACTAHGGIPLASPVRDVDPLTSPLLGLRKDRLLKSVVPGEVDDREAVTVALGPEGPPAVVTDLQQLTIHGAGNYIVRELGPARAAVGLGDTVPPVLELGTVVWQGFSPGLRELSARLTLDPGIEAARLPLKVTLRLRDAAGRVRALDPGGKAPADG